MPSEQSRCLCIVGLLMFTLINPKWGYTEGPPHQLEIDIQENGVAKIHAQLFIQASQKQVFRVLTNYEQWPALFPEGFQIELSTCSEECAIIADMIIPNALVPWTTHLRVKTKEHPHQSLEIHLIEGDYVQYQLMWTFAPTNVSEHTHATMDFTLQPERTITDWTPDFLYEWAIRKGLEDHFDKILEQVKAISSHSVTTSQ